MPWRWNIKIKVIVDLNKIKTNLAAIRQKLDFDDKKKHARLMLMLKADAYGHGLEQVAKSTSEKVDAFGVFSLEEGLKVREIAPKTPVLVNMLGVNEIHAALQNDLTIGLSNLQQLDEIERLSENEMCAKALKIHLKVDSGMHRLGFQVDDVSDVCKRLANFGTKLAGVYSHFGDHPELQIEGFDNACKIAKEFFPNVIRHISSSHTFDDVSKRYDGVRIGLMAYLGAMSVESQVIATRHVDCGEYIGYGNYVASKSTNVAVVFGGYADGIDRESFKSVLWKNRRFDVIGVCMDSFVIDTQNTHVNIGDKITILDAKQIEKTAKEMNTIPYTLMTAWRGRIDKIYC